MIESPRASTPSRQSVTRGCLPHAEALRPRRPRPAAARDRDSDPVRPALQPLRRSGCARFPTVASVLLVTRTQLRPFFRWTVIFTVAARLVETVTVAERFFTLGDTAAICAIGQPSFEIAYSVGQASERVDAVVAVRVRAAEAAAERGQPLAERPVHRRARVIERRLAVAVVVVTARRASHASPSRRRRRRSGRCSDASGSCRTLSVDARRRRASGHAVRPSWRRLPTVSAHRRAVGVAGRRRRHRPASPCRRVGVRDRSSSIGDVVSVDSPCTAIVADEASVRTASACEPPALRSAVRASRLTLSGQARRCAPRAARRPPATCGVAIDVPSLTRVRDRASRSRRCRRRARRRRR